MKIPIDKNFGFVEYEHQCSVNYAIQAFQETKLYGQKLKLNIFKSNSSPRHDSTSRLQYHQTPAIPLPIENIRRHQGKIRKRNRRIGN